MLVLRPSLTLLLVCLIFGALGQSSSAEELNAKQLLLRSLQVAEEISNQEDKNYGFQSIAVAQAQAGDLSAALKTVQRMSVGRQNSVFSEVARVRAKAGDMKDALEALDRIHNEDVRISGDGFRFPPELLRGESLKTIAIDQGLVGDTNLALQTVSRIPLAAGKYAAQWKIEALEGIALAQAEAKDMNGAIATANMIEEKNKKGSVLHRLAKMFANAGDVKHALESANLIDSDVIAYKGWALCRIAEAQARNGDLPGAKQTVREAIELASTEKYEGTRGGLLGGVAGTLTRIGDLEGADRIAVSLSNNRAGSKDNAFKHIAEAQSEIGSGKAALASVANIQNEQTKNSALVEIASRLSKAGDMENALLAANSSRDETSKTGALLNISRGQMSAGDLKGALQTISLITKNETKSLALKEVTEVQIKNGHIQGALETALLNEGFWRVDALGAVSKVQAKGGDIKGALQSTATLKAGIQRGRILQDIARRQAQAGDIDGALDWSNRLAPIEKTLVLVGMAQGLSDKNSKAQR